MEITEESQNLNFSFSGCGFLGIYHLGVAACLKQHAHQHLNIVSGASAGALASCAILANVPLNVAAAHWLTVCGTTRSKVIGVLSPSCDVFDIVRQNLEATIPQDGHLLVNDKINISLTRLRDLSNFVASNFASRSELIEALLCAITIPMFVGTIPPSFRGKRTFDGGFTKNLLIYDNNTITVSPFCGMSDICPRDAPSLSPWVFQVNNTSVELSVQNLMRMSHILMPPSVGALAQLCQDGYNDAFRFLGERNLLKCENCKGLKNENRLKDLEFSNFRCCKCGLILRNSELPESMQQTFRDYTEADKNCVYTKMKRKKIAKLLRVATLPLLLYIDFVYAVARKLKVN